LALPAEPTKPALTGFPKVELHRHLEGSLRMSTVLDLARSEALFPGWDEDRLAAAVRVNGNEEHSWANFLGKFDTLRALYGSPEVIDRITREAIEDAAQDGVRHLELRFTPGALARRRRFPIEQVFGWVVDAAREASRDQAVSVRLIASVNRHETVEEAEQVAQAASDWIGRGVVGLDLAGNEVEYPAEPFRAIFLQARQAGLGLTVHAGEWTGAATVEHAMVAMQADRIAHGVRILDDPRLVAMAVERRICFEVCLTSNVLSGVVPRLEDHPLPRMIEAGLQVTLNTDDPSVCGVRLSDEYSRALSHLGLSTLSLAGLVLTAAQASFLTQRERARLEAELRPELMAAA
jgi:adenosine deaminase